MHNENSTPVKYYIIVMICAITAGNWHVTQMIAEDCAYNELLGPHLALGGFHVYQPFASILWKNDESLDSIIHIILISHDFWLYFWIMMGLMLCYFLNKSGRKMTSHGTADFANAKDIERMGLNDPSNGVVVGRNPFNNKIMLHNGPEHIFLAAPTRSGKGVGIIIPTGIIWKHSIFFFDPKAELWESTAGFRKKKFHQKVMKFEPLCSDGSSARWNPYAEINFQSFDEVSDVSTINEIMVRSGETKDPFWENSAIAMLNGVVLHLLYKNWREEKELPCPTDVMSFISSPILTTMQIYGSMTLYPHISYKHFLELEYEAEEEDKDGNIVKVTKRYRNPLKEIYGTYVDDLRPYVKALRGLAEDPLTEDEWKSIMKLPEDNPTIKAKLAFENLRLAILRRKKYIGRMKDHAPISFDRPDIKNCSDKNELEAMLKIYKQPFWQLLVHPKIAESASNIIKNAEDTRNSIIQSAKTPLSLYQDPLIRKNTAVSDFCFRDLLNPAQAVSLYMVLQPNDIDKLRPLTRLFVNTLIAKTVRDMKFDTPAEERQRLLLMLDEFPQLKKMETIGQTLAICAGYGVKICTVVQNITQLNEIYTKDGSAKILSNSQVQIYMTPSDLETAKTLSDMMGDKTIESVSKSSNGKLMDGGSTSISQQARKLMTPDEVLRMDKDTKELVLVQGGKPILADKIHWYKEEFFKKRVFVIPPPVFSDTCTEIRDFHQLEDVHAADVADMREKQKAVEEAKQKAVEAAEKKQDGQSKRTGVRLSKDSDKPASEKADAKPADKSSEPAVKVEHEGVSLAKSDSGTDADKMVPEAAESCNKPSAKILDESAGNAVPAIDGAAIIEEKTDMAGIEKISEEQPEAPKEAPAASDEPVFDRLPGMDDIPPEITNATEKRKWLQKHRLKYKEYMKNRALEMKRQMAEERSRMNDEKKAGTSENIPEHKAGGKADSAEIHGEPEGNIGCQKHGSEEPWTADKEEVGSDTQTEGTMKKPLPMTSTSDEQDNTTEDFLNFISGIRNKGSNEDAEGGNVNG